MARLVLYGKSVHLQHSDRWRC